MAVTSTAAASPSGNRSGLTSAVGTVIGLTLLSRVVGLVRDIIVNHIYGLSGPNDAYTAAFKLPDLLMYLIAGGALASTFVPVFSEYLKNKDEKGAWKTFSVVATVTFIVATILVVLGEIFAPWFIKWMNWGYHDGPRLNLAVHLTRIVLPAQIFFMVGSLFMGTLNARNRFLIPSLGPTIYNVGIIIGAFFHTGPSGLMWGALGGAFVGNFALQIYQVVQVGMRYRPSLDITFPGAMKIWKMMIPILLGVSLPNVDQIISGSFSSALSIGSQAAITTATRLMLIPIGIFAQAMGIAFLPTMSQQAGNPKQFRSTTARALRFVLFLTVPSSALMFVLASPIIGLIYQNGHFTAHDTYRTAFALRFYALGIFAWSAQAILTRGFYALQDSRTPVISGTIMTVIFIGMSWFSVHFHPVDWNIGGLAMATSIAATMHMIVMYVFLRRRAHGLQGFKTLAMIIKLAIATGFLSGITYGVELLLHARWSHPHFFQFLMLVFVPATVGGIVFLGAAAALRMEETKMLGELVSRFTGRKAAKNGSH
jgi:putative peptidoglycan lipid II flippase